MQARYLFLVILFLLKLTSGAALAQATAPTRGGEVNATRVTSTTIELSFGTSGNGQGRVVAIAATNGGMPVPLAATNGQFYTGAATYGEGAPLGQGYVVYNGTGHSVTVTGLQPSTYYYLTNAEYATDGSDIAYNTNGTSVSISTRAASTAQMPLPVELTVFSGAVDARGVAMLRWSTASEHNTAYFALERSPDGKTFAEAGRVAAATTSSQPLAYQWLDAQRLTQLTYYRLRQADLDGSATYSSVVALAPAPSAGRLVDVYPNPSAGQAVQLLLQGYSGEVLTLRLIDALGRLVISQVLTPSAAQYTLALAPSQRLVAGTYMLSLGGATGLTQKRVVVSN